MSSHSADLLVANPSHRVTRAVIPAAGLGTRLRPLTYAFPKELLPVGRKPVLDHIVGELRSAGITRALFIVSEAKPQIRGYFGDVYGDASDGLSPIECSYVFQNEQKGLGHALSLSREWTAGDPFVVAFGDCIIETHHDVSPLQRLLETHQINASSATTLVETVPEERVSRYGIVAPVRKESDDTYDIELNDIVEKPSPELAPSRLAVAARWVLENEIFEFLDRGQLDERGEVNLTDAVRMLKRAGGNLWAVRLRPDEARRDIGNFGSFFDAFVRAALRDEEFGASVQRTFEEELERRM